MIYSIRRQFSRVLLVIGVSTVLIGAAAQPATASTVFYADHVNTTNFQWHSTGVVSSISGGKVGANLGIGLLQISTYVSYPGFNVYATSDGGAPGYVYLLHAAITNHKSRCRWYTPGLDKSAEAILTCAYSD